MGGAMQEGPLGKRLHALPPAATVKDDEILEAFLAYVADEGLSLYPAQEEAILEFYDGKNVILNTPTGSGKSLVALAVHFRALVRGERAFYTSPIKALANEKFFQLARALSPEWVGMATGDAAINRDAGVVCCTAEVLSNLALSEGAAADVAAVVMDEFHYYGDRERGVAWQVPLLLLRDAQFLLMSATLGPTDFFERDLTARTARPTVTVRSGVRPVPLDFGYRESPLHETIQDLLRRNRAPIYLVNFTQRGAAEEAQNLMSLDVADKETKQRIAAMLVGFRFDTPYGRDMQRFLRHGIGVHHAGLLPKYRLLVERLAQEGLLSVISGTDTLGVGVNVPIRTVAFTKLCKFDGEKTALLTARDFHQVSGRAGRRGFDTEGSVVAQAPEHVVENLRLESKALQDPNKKKKFVRKKPPERGYVHWDKPVFERLISQAPEPLKSRFSVTHGMVLEMLTRPRASGGGYMALARLIYRCHERKEDKRALGRTAYAMMRSLLEAGVILRTSDGFFLREGLQRDFSMHHALDLYLLQVLPQLKEQSEVYALDLLSVVEAIAEDPTLLLERQLDKLKREKIGELKAQGVEFDARIEAIDKMEYPKPNAAFIYDTFNAFARLHPWVSTENVKPKGIARELIEGFYSFNEMVRELGVERAEGLVLRYLSEVYRILSQTVPMDAKTAEVLEMEDALAAIVKSTDGSLLAEWERMVRGSVALAPMAAPAPAESLHFTQSKGFRTLVRNALFACLRAVDRGNYLIAAEALGAEPHVEHVLRQLFKPFFAEHRMFRLDAVARGNAYFRFTQGIAAVVRTAEGAESHVALQGEQSVLAVASGEREVALPGMSREMEDETDQDDAPEAVWVLKFAIDMDRSHAESRAVLQILGFAA
jgi:superfamily II RNA helicase